jgi:predicted DNA-binding protein (MmcQ/YjbR family)
MNIEDFRQYCLSLTGVKEEFPFDETTLVFKVRNKMFALTSLDTAFRFTVKCTPEEGESLRERYLCIEPAWHMNKRHWIMVTPDGGIDDHTMKSLITRSYDLIVEGLSRYEKEMLKNSL